MKRRPYSLLLTLSLISAAPALLAAEELRYVSDEVSVPLRAAPDNDADLLGVLKSGDKVSVLRSLGPQSYTQVQTSRGTEGWLPSRYLSEDPAAQVRLRSAQRERDQARAQAERLQNELDTARKQLAAAAPAFELADENQRLREQMQELQQRSEELKQFYDEEKARRKTLITGAALVGGGILAGLILPLLGRGRRRSYGDL